MLHQVMYFQSTFIIKDGVQLNEFLQFRCDRHLCRTPSSSQQERDLRAF